MRKVLFLLLLASTTVFTGCFDVVEEVFLNKNGSGKYHITMDMSGLFTDPFMKDMVNDAIKQQQGMDASAALEKDSVIYFKDLKQTEELSAEEKKALDNLLMRMTLSESKKQMLIKIEYDFDKVEDIAKMSEVLQKIGADQQMGGGIPGGNLISGNTASFSWKKGILKRLPVAAGAAAQSDENMEMMKMFLNAATYKTIYHLPGKVKNTDIPKATVNGEVVTIENAMLDIIEGKAKLDGAIKFK